MVYLLIFYKPSLRFIWVHVLAHFWSPVYASFRRSASFFLRLPARPFSGLVGEVDSPPIFYPDMSISVVIFPIYIVYFYRVHLQHLGFLGNLEDSALFLRFFLSIFCVCWIFGGLQSCHQIHYQFPRKLLKLFRPIFIEVYALFDRFLVSDE